MDAASLGTVATLVVPLASGLAFVAFQRRDLWERLYIIVSATTFIIIVGLTIWNIAILKAVASVSVRKLSIGIA